MHKNTWTIKGPQPGEGIPVLIMIHGRGGSADDILSLATHLDTDGFSLVAPEAVNNTWYPYSFMAPASNNEPWLSSALEVLSSLVTSMEAAGVRKTDIWFLGFSQGACLMLEYITRHAARFGGAIAFTGGLIGEQLKQENYKGDFGGMPVFIGTSDPDPHVPVNRVQETTGILKDMNAAVTTKIYPGMGHTINQDEIVEANRILRYSE